MPEQRVVLAGSHRNAAPGAKLVGRTNPAEIVHVTVVLQRRKPISAAVLGRHARLKPHERPATSAAAFARDYGASAQAVQAVRAFAASFGLRVTRADRSRRIVELSGPVAKMEQAFGTELHDCMLGQRRYRGRRGPLLIPRKLARHVEAVLGLDNRPVAAPRRIRPRAAGAVSYYPQQLAALYGFPQGDGSGQTIALIELGGNYGPADLKTYFAAAGVTRAPQVRSVAVGTGVPVAYGQDKDSDGEVMLDIEVVGAIAPGAQIVVYFAENTDQGFYQAASQAVHDPATTAVSISWGSPEKDWSAQSMEAWNSLGQSAAMLDVPIFVAAGDHGCTDEENTDPGYDAQRHVDFPGTCANGVVSCGGTHLAESGGRIASERVWNDGDGWASGGGISTYFTAPAWQGGLSAEPGSVLRMRGVPDVAADADPQSGINVRVNGADGVSGGTSAAAPQWAALAALLSAQLGRRAGFFVPLMYQHASTPTTHDIVSGNNSVFGVTGFQAQKGWDACTGLGSPSGAELLELLRAPAATGARRARPARRPRASRPRAHR